MKKSFLFIVPVVIMLYSCDGPGYTERRQGVVISAPTNFWKDRTLKDSLFLSNCDSISNGLLVRSDSTIFVTTSTDTLFSAGTPVYIYTSNKTKNLHLPNWPSIAGVNIFKYKDIRVLPEIHNEKQFILGWLQMTISLCVIFIMLSIWINFHVQQMPKITLEDLIKKLKTDKGIIFICLALFFWASIGIIRIYSSNDPTGNTGLNDVLIRIFSLTNNMFFLLALPFFKHGIEHFNRYKIYYGIFAGLLFFFSFLIIIALGINASKYIKTMKLFDVSYSAVVLTLLGYILYKSFSNRGFKAIAKLTALITIGVVFAQVSPYFLELRLSLGNAGYIIYHTTFIMTTTLLISLMFSWYNEERERMIKDGFLNLQEVVLEKDDTTLGLNKKHIALKDALSKGYAEQVLSALISSPEKDTEDIKILIIQSGNYNKVKRDYMAGIITHTEYTHFLSKLISVLDDFINKWFPKKNGTEI